MNKYDILIDYLNMEEKNPLGCGRLAPLILMINEDEKIVAELLETSNFKNKSCLLSFLDYGLRALIDNKQYETSNIYNKIVYVLSTFESLEDKWAISGDNFVKILRGTREV